jgi:hypothetical protein
MPIFRSEHDWAQAGESLAPNKIPRLARTCSKAACTKPGIDVRSLSVDAQVPASCRSTSEQTLANLGLPVAAQNSPVHAESASDRIIGLDARGTKLLAKLEVLGFNHETVKLLHLLPLVQTAWADNRVDPREMALILDLSRQRGVLPGSPSEQVLSEWLRKRPANELFREGLGLINEILCSRPAEVRRKMTGEIVELCARVAAASGGFFGLGEKITGEERRAIRALREHVKVTKESAGSPLN